MGNKMAYMNCVKGRSTAEYPTPEARNTNSNNNKNNVFLILTLKQRIIMTNKISYELKKHPDSQNLKRRTRFMLYTTLIRLTHLEVNVGSSQRRMEICSRNFERKILRMIYDTISDNVIWRTRHNNELYTLYEELDILQVIKVGRMRCLRHLFRDQEMGPCRKLTLLKPEGT